MTEERLQDFRNTITEIVTIEKENQTEQGFERIEFDIKNKRKLP